MASPSDDANRRPVEPFAAGSVALIVHPETGAPEQVLEHLVRQARAAEAAGFDGVCMSEHHAGHEHYLPTPLLASSWLLSATDRVWAGACPLLLALRPTTLVIESVAWQAARFPGRVGIGFAPGYSDDDFAVMGVDSAASRKKYWDELDVVCDALRRGVTSDLLARDPAVSVLNEKPIPVVAAAGGPRAARRAARAGAGLVLATFTSAARGRELFDEYESAGGDGPRVMSRRVWLGDPPVGWLDALRRRYEAAGVEPAFLEVGPSTELVTAADPESLARELAGVAHAGGATALSVRVSLPGATPEQILEQISAVGKRVLPPLRRLLSSQQQRASTGVN